MSDFNPIVLNCVLLYLTVVVLSLFQSRFRIVKDDPLTFCLLLIFTPLLMFGKAAKLRTWTSITGVEIFGWTLMLAYFNPKRIVPKVNEGYIYAYTLFHWYLLIDTTLIKGFNVWMIIVFLVSIYPTYLILKAAFEKNRLSYNSKLILYYWFLFAIIFTYIDQVALDIIQPILAIEDVSFTNTIYVMVTGVQLYFIATSISLLFVGVPLFHLDRSFDSWKSRWKRAKREWREIVNHKLGNFIEYQISLIQVFLITVVSGGLFYIDRLFDFRLYLIFFYTVIFPVIFFYIKYTPEENFIEEAVQTDVAEQKV